MQPQLAAVLVIEMEVFCLPRWQSIPTTIYHGLLNPQRCCHCVPPPIGSSMITYGPHDDVVAGCLPFPHPNGDHTAKAHEQHHLNTTENSKLVSDDTNSNFLINQTDATSPLFSVGSFEDLNLRPELLSALYEKGFSKPSRIQENTLPLICGTYGRPQNLIAQAQSGSGKTAAFSLGMLSRIEEAKSFVQALCVCPTRELARQLHQEIVSFAKFTQIKVFLAIRDGASSGGRRQQVEDSHIVVGTPGTIYDLIRNKAIDTKHISIFVLDEAELMLDQQGLKDQTLRIQRQLPRESQVLLFSATYDDQVAEFAQSIVPHPRTTMRLKPADVAAANIRQHFVRCINDSDKFYILSEMYAHMSIGQSIIFCQRKHTASWLSSQMIEAGHAVSLLHGDLDTADRDTIIDDYRSGRTKVLITTNVLARGIDITQITLVVNYDIPVDALGAPDFSTYIHRIGRAGRFGRLGIAINFVSDEMSYHVLKKIESHYGLTIEELLPEDLLQLDSLYHKMA